MLGRTVLRLVGALLALTRGGTSSGITFANNGYSNVVVSISPNVDGANQIATVDNIKAWISQGSQDLFVATNKMAYMESVDILLPESWTDPVAEPSTSLTYTDGAVRVDTANPLYGDDPYTVQPGGCKEPGQYIHVTKDFLVNLNTTSTQTFGYVGKVFVHEWAKFRYGVFEEHGYPGDPVYPLFYYVTVTDADGQHSTLTPNFCTDSPLVGNRADVNGGSCSFNQDTGLPDKNCYYYFNEADNPDVKSSLMAITSLKNVDHFCESEDGDYEHDPDKPTKHNLLCDQKPVWQVIQESPDFDRPGGVKPMKNEVAPPTKFRILRPQMARFAMVIDTSGSMDQNGNRRLERVKQSASDWLTYDVQNGSSVAIINFADDAKIDKRMTMITGTQARKDLVSIINNKNYISARGSTNIGAGLTLGMDQLNPNGATKGGVIILMTDGQNNKPPHDNLARFRDRIIRDQVRIVTMAIGSKSDQMLENFARWSNGQTYFIHDGDSLDDLNSAFEAALTYQPSVPLTDEDIGVYDKSLKSNSRTVLTDSFSIDATLGRDVTVTLSIPQTDVSKTAVFHMLEQNGTVFQKSLTARTTQIHFDQLEAGSYSFNVTSRQVLQSVDIKVTSKASTQGGLPLWTKCWISTGLKDVDAQEDKLAILAKVTHGNDPVMNADVLAYIEREGETAPIEIQLLDNGSGADNVADDGLYSRYFTRYNGKNGRYTLRCRVKNSKDTKYVPDPNFVTGGSRRRVRRSVGSDQQLLIGPRAQPVGIYPKSPGSTPVCCGSDSGLSSLPSKSTGQFERHNNAGSFHVKNAPANNVDLWPPNRVLDLTVGKFQEEFFIVNFTAPGDDYDSGKPTNYTLTYTIVVPDPTNSTKSYTQTTQVFESDIISGSVESPLNANEKVVLVLPLNTIFNRTNTNYKFHVFATDEAGNAGHKSNSASYCNQCYTPDDSGGLSGGAIAGIVIGVLVAIVMVGIVAFVVVKKQRGEEVINMNMFKKGQQSN